MGDPYVNLLAGLSAGSAVTAPIAAANLNSKNRKWSEQMANQQQVNAWISQNAQNAYNTQEREAVQAFNAAEAQKARDWTENVEFAHQKDMMLLQHQLQSPVEMMRQFRNAGLNPSVAMGGNFGQGVSQPSGQAAAQASAGTAGNSSVGSPSFPSLPQGFPLFQNGSFAGSFKEVAEAFAAVAQAKKTGAETGQIEKMLEKYALSEDLKNSILQEQGAILKAFGKSEAAMRVLEAYAHAAQLAAQGNESETNAALNKAKAATEEEVKNLRGYEARKAKAEAERIDEILSAEIRKANASANESNATARNQNAQAQTEDETREGRVSSITEDARFKKLQVDFQTLLQSGGKNSALYKKFNEELRQLTAERKLSELDAKEKEQLVPLLIEAQRLANEANDYHTGQYWFNVLANVFSTAGTAAAIVYGGKGRGGKPTPVRGFGK